MTDNVPLHVLGGNIIPMALGSEFMLTQAVRNASHALVVAFPKANSTYAGLHALPFHKRCLPDPSLKRVASIRSIVVVDFST